MNQLLRHADYEELLGVYALDALEGAEAAAVEVHLMECPRCRDEVARHRETAALLGQVGATAPPGLWDRIAGELTKVPPALALVRVPPGHGTGSAGVAGTGPVGAGPVGTGPVGAGPVGVAGRSERGSRHRRIGARSVAILVGAAAVVIGVLAFEVSSLQGQVSQIRQSETVASIPRLAALALGNPGRDTVSLRSANSRASASAVIVPDGQGYLIDAKLPRLSSKQTYQLWALSGGNAISLGLLGPSPTPAAFHVDFAQVTELMITVEPASGVAQPDSSLVVSGSPVSD